MDRPSSSKTPTDRTRHDLNFTPQVVGTGNAFLPASSSQTPTDGPSSSKIFLWNRTPLDLNFTPQVVGTGNAFLPASSSQTPPTTWHNFGSSLKLDEYWDPEDSSTWDSFLADDIHAACRSPLFRIDRLFLKNHPPPPGLEISGSFVFELYKIELKKVDPRREQNFSTILMASSATKMVNICMYKHPQGEEINLDKSIALKGPFRPPNADYSVIISLSNPANGGWAFYYEGPAHTYSKSKLPVYNTPICEYVEDEATDSVALISYELMQKAATATLWFEFVDRKDRDIEILAGTISATNNGDANTLRIIKHVSSNKPIMVKSNQRFSVDRAAFGVPIDSVLFVSVKLIYRAGGRKNRIRELLHFKAQKESKVEERLLYGEGPNVNLNIKVSWSDNQWDDI